MHRFQTIEKLTPTETNRGSRENSLKKKSSTVFVDSAKKNKKKSSLQNLGFEYDHDVTNDTDYCKRIIEKNCYVADYNSPSLPKSTFSLNALAEVTNKKRDDTSILVEGKAVPSHPLRLAASLSEVEPEVTLSKYAQKKLGKKAKSKNGILLEDVYLIKLNWLRKMAQIQSKTHKHNLNTFRLIFEEIIEEISPAFEVQMFSNQKQVTQILRKLSHFLAKLEPQKAILLSYKLFKMHLKQLDLNETQSRMEVAKKLHSFLLPYARLMEIKEAHPSEKDHKERTKLVTYRKIIKFINGAEITNILLEYPDPKKTVEYTVRFQAFLGQRLSLEQAIAKLNRKNKEIIEEMPIDSIREYEEKIEHEEILKAPILLDIPTYHYVREIVREIPERSPIDKSFENARSFELEESFSEHRKNVLGYDFNERCCNLGKAEKIFAVGGSNPKSKTDLALPKLVKGFSKESNNNASIESSNDDQGEGSDSEVELMKDPELYQAFSKNEVPADRELPKLVLDENLIRGDKRAFSCIAVKSKDNIESPSKKLRTSMHLSRQGSGNKDGVLCCDDINTKADPMRISHKPDFVRLNSFENLAHSEEENKKANDNQSPSQKHNGEGKSDLGVIKRPSICQSRLTVNKTKREITFQKIINIAYDEISKWETVINTQLIRIQKIRPENSPVVLLRAWTCIEGFTPKEVFEQIYDTTQRAKWDTVTVGLRVIEYLEDSSEVIYFYIKTPFGITERDFVQRRDYTFDYPEKDTIIMSFQSCLHPSMPPYKNRIRGETHLAGYIIKPSVNKPGSTDLCILSQVDIKGSVPKAIVNMVAAKAPADWVNKLRKACEKTRHQK